MGEVKAPFATSFFDWAISKATTDDLLAIRSIVENELRERLMAPEMLDGGEIYTPSMELHQAEETNASEAVEGFERRS